MTPELYERMWAHDAYRAVAPGEQLAYRFVELAKPTSRVIDFGAGTGRGAALIHALANVPVLALDFAANALDAGVRGIDGIEFRQHDLRRPVGDFSEWGYCTDVLEHIAPEDVGKVLQNILTAARRVFFAISTVPDHFGPAIAGEPLHLTVEDAYWWHDALTDLGARVEWSDMTSNGAMFVASGFQNAEDFLERSALNVEREQIKANIVRNLGLGLREVAPHAVQETTVYLLAGGPSLAQFEQHVVEAGKAGIPCVTVNGTYNWLLQRGIRPAMQIMVDARAFNRRFVDPLVDTCAYVISSQCDHEVLKSLPAEQTWLWHSHGADVVREAMSDFGVEREWYPIAGGSTVASSALVVLAMLGFRRVEVFGLDSCLMGDEHHAYAQPENDGEQAVDVVVAGRKFRCAGWMLIQARDIQHVIRNVLGKVGDFEMIVHGDGLIAHMLNVAAERAAGKGV